MSGRAIYLSLKEQELILEAIGMLRSDYEEGHVEDEALTKISVKMLEQSGE